MIHEYVDHMKLTLTPEQQEPEITSFEAYKIHTTTPNTTQWITQYIHKNQQRKTNT